MLKPAIALFLWFVCLPSVAMAQETSESTLPDDWPLSTLESEGIDPEPIMENRMIAERINYEHFRMARSNVRNT